MVVKRVFNTVEETKLRAFETVAETWNSHGVNYVIAHGLSKYPQQLGRDLDVVVSAEQVDQALSVATEVLAALGWSIATPPPLWGRRLVAFKDDWAIEIHTLTSLSWKGVELARVPPFSSQASVGPFKVDAWMSFAKAILTPLLAGDFERFRVGGKSRDELRIPASEVSAVLSQLADLCSYDVSEGFLKAVGTRDLEALEGLMPRLRWSMLAHALKNRPVSLAKGAVGLGGRRLRQPFSPCSPVVALVGPDGVGKSTLLQSIRERHGSIFTGVAFRHWRPGVLPQLGALTGRIQVDIEDLSNPPRREPGRGFLLRLLYYGMDFFVGYYLRDRMDSSRQRLIIYDRCFLDMAVDPVRYGLSSTWGMKRLWRWLPKPDLIILLRDDPERIYARKPELPVPEIRRQLDEWQKLVEMKHVDAVIDVDASSDELAQRATKLIVDAFIRLNKPEGPNRAGVK